MKFNKIILSLAISFSCLGLVNAEEQAVNTKTYTETQAKEMKDTLDSDYLFQYYKETSGDTRVQIDYQYLINEPMNMDEIRDLKHPYFDKHLSNLTDDDVEEIMNNKMQHKFKGLRENSIHDEAIKYGIQSALYKILSDFSLKMDNISPFYENTFNFNSLMLYNGRVKPPVVLKTMGSLAKENKKLLRQVKRAYNFHSQAEVVIRPPSFRDYLTFEAIRPTEPNPLLLPLPNKPKEMHVWQKGVSEGWIQGLRQAYLVIDEGLISLVRDFFGMQRYIGMLDEGIVTLPVVTESDLATSSNGTSINIGESTFTISELPEFNTNDHTWRAIPRVDGIFNNFYLDDKDKEKLKLLKEELEIDKY